MVDGSFRHGIPFLLEWLILRLLSINSLKLVLIPLVRSLNLTFFPLFLFNFAFFLLKSSIVKSQNRHPRFRFQFEISLFVCSSLMLRSTHTSGSQSNYKTFTELFLRSIRRALHHLHNFNKCFKLHFGEPFNVVYVHRAQNRGDNEVQASTSKEQCQLYCLITSRI